MRDLVGATRRRSAPHAEALSGGPPSPTGQWGRGRPERCGRVWGDGGVGWGAGYEATEQANVWLCLTRYGRGMDGLYQLSFWPHVAWPKHSVKGSQQIRLRVVVLGNSELGTYEKPDVGPGDAGRSIDFLLLLLDVQRRTRRTQSKGIVFFFFFLL